jgi:uncharacterized protein (DUF305 family)
MIPHHESAIVMAKTELAYGKVPVGANALQRDRR